MDAPRQVVLVHDLSPHEFALRAWLEAATDHVIHLKNGTERQLLASDRVLELLAKNPRFRVVVAPYALPVVDAASPIRVRSVVPVAHPILRMLGALERKWADHATGQDIPEGTPASFEASVAVGLRAHLRRYPYTNFHTGFLLGAQAKVEPADAVPLAATLLRACRFGLTDFHATLRTAIGDELTAAGLPAREPAEPTSAAPMVPALKRWRDRLTRPVFQRLCRLNEADLRFYDAVAAAVAQDGTLPAGLRARIEATVEAAAEVTGHRKRETVVAVSKPAPPSTEPPSEGLIEPDPVLGWRLRADAATTINVAGEMVMMQTDSAGCRPVPGQAPPGQRTVVVYGCSCAFGWAVPVEATLCAQLQAALPGWRVENRAVNGYGQTQNLLQLTRDLRFNAPDHVTFTWIAPHLVRNVAAPTQVQRQTEMARADRLSLIRAMPRAGLDASGALSIRDVRYTRSDLVGLDLTDFNPDPYYAYLVSAALFRRAAELVRRRGGRFFVTLLRERLPTALAELLEASGIPVLDAIADGPDHTSGFDNHHPNGRAHRYYGATLAAYLQSVDAELVPA